jgi:hypothetical protein
MSSYPPPPPSTSDGTGPTPNNPQQGADSDNRQTHQSQTHPQFAAEAAAAAVAAAHHGLQALQAAVAAPAPVPSPSSVTSQHASLADASSYLTGNDAGPSPGGGPNAKATRLRRACDMCSQRKVKVRITSRRGEVATSTNLFLLRSATRPSHASPVSNSASTALSTGQ